MCLNEFRYDCFILLYCFVKQLLCYFFFHGPLMNTHWTLPPILKDIVKRRENHLRRDLLFGCFSVFSASSCYAHQSVSLSVPSSVYWCQQKYTSTILSFQFGLISPGVSNLLELKNQAITKFTVREQQGASRRKSICITEHINITGN